MFDAEIDVSEFKAGFSNYLKKFSSQDKKAMATVGLLFINNVSNGIGDTNAAPPILTGRLRGSGSAFVEGVYAGSTFKLFRAGTPATSGADKEKGVVMIVFNTPYATRWHENPFNPGPVSLQYGNASTKYVEKHLESDAELIAKQYAEFQKETVVN